MEKQQIETQIENLRQTRLSLEREQEELINLIRALNMEIDAWTKLIEVDRFWCSRNKGGRRCK